MFEGLVCELLTRLLGKYIANLNADQLSLGIWGGDVVLANLEFKPDALQGLNLPINVVKGIVGKLVLKIPWTALGSQPVVVNVDQVFLLLGPEDRFQYDEAAETKKLLLAKKAKLDQYEVIKLLKEGQGSSEGSAKNQSFTASLITKVIDNLQIEINKIHIRYEATHHNGTSFAIGLTVDSVQLKSTDEHWAPRFMQYAGNDLRFKIGTISCLSAYILPESPSMRNIPAREVLVQLMNQIPTPSSLGVLAPFFVIDPITASIKVTMNFSPEIQMDKPKITVACNINQISVSMQESQYHTALCCIELLSQYVQSVKYLKYRPQQRPNKTNLKEWWHYAMNVTREQVRTRMQRTSFHYVVKRLMDQRRYIEYYKRSQGVKWWTPLDKQEQQAYSDLEDSLPYEDIIFYRSIATAALRKEAENAKKREELITAQKQREAERKKATQSSWGSWFGWGKKPETPAVTSTPEPEPEQVLPTVELTKEQYDQVISLVGYSESISSVEPPKEYVKLRGALLVGSLTFSLKDEVTGLNILTGVFERTYLSALIRTENIHVEAQLDKYDVVDNFTKNSHFPKIVSTTSTTSGSLRPPPLNTQPTLSSASSTTQDNDHFVKLSLDLKPLDGHADTAVEVTINPMTFTLTKPFLDRVVQFFTPSETLDIAAMSDLASDQLNNLVKATRAQLELAVQLHKTVDLRILIAAPTVLIPQFADRSDTPFLMVDFGTLAITSEPKHAETAVLGGEIVNLDFYDSYNIQLTAVKMILSSNATDLSTPTNRNIQVVEDFSILLKGMVCIQPNELTLTTLIVTGSLPSLTVNLSLEKYNLAMGMLAMFLENLLPSASSDSPPLDNSSAESKQINEILLVPDNLLIKHKSFEAFFTIPCLTVNLSDMCRDGQPPSPLIAVHLEGISAHFTKRTWDMHLDTKLGNLKVEDCIAKSRGLDFVDMVNSVHSGQELLHITYHQTSPVSPEYANVDISLETHLGNLFAYCNPETVSALIAIILEIKPPSFRSAKPPPPESLPIVKPPVSYNNPVILTKLSVSVSTLGLVLVLNNTKFAEFQICGINSDICLNEDTTLGVMVEIGGVSVDDCNATEGSFCRHLISMQDSSTPMISMNYSTFTTYKSPGWDSSIDAKIKCIHVNLVQDFFIQLVKYVVQGPLLAPLRKAQVDKLVAQTYTSVSQNLSDTVIQYPHKITRTKMDIHLEAPEVIIPSPKSPQSSVLIQMGQLSLKNSFLIEQTNYKASTVPIECLCLNLENVNLVTVQNGVPVPLSSGIGFKATINRALIEYDPQLKVSLIVPNIEISASEEQIIFLMNQYLEVTKTIEQIVSLASQAPSTLGTGKILEEVSEANPSVKLSEPPQTKVTTAEVKLELKKLSLCLSNSGTSPLFKSTLSESVVFLSLAASTMKLTASVSKLVIQDERQISDIHFKHLFDGMGTEEQPLLTLDYLRDNSSNSQAVSLSIQNPKIFILPSILEDIKLSAMRLFPHITSTPTQSPQHVDPVLVTKKAPITIAVSLKNPEIFAVLDEYSLSPCFGIAGSFSIQLKDTTDMQVQGSDIQVSVFTPTSNMKSREAQHYILSPSSLDLNVVNTPAKQHIKVVSPAIATSLTFGDIKLATKLLNTLLPLIKISKSSDNPSTPPQEPPNIQHEIDEKFELFCKYFTVTFNDDTRAVISPFSVLDLKSASVHLSNWSSQMEFNISMEPSFTLFQESSENPSVTVTCQLKLSKPDNTSNGVSSETLATYSFQAINANATIYQSKYPFIGNLNVGTSVTQSPSSTEICLSVLNPTVSISQDQIIFLLKQYTFVNKFLGTASELLKEISSSKLIMGNSDHVEVPPPSNTAMKTSVDLGNMKILLLQQEASNICEFLLSKASATLRSGDDVTEINASIFQLRGLDRRSETALKNACILKQSENCMTPLAQLSYRKNHKSLAQSLCIQLESPTICLLPHFLLTMKVYITALFPYIPKAKPSSSDSPVDPVHTALTTNVSIRNLSITCVGDELSTSPSCVTLLASTNIDVQQISEDLQFTLEASDISSFIFQWPQIVDELDPDAVLHSHTAVTKHQILKPTSFSLLLNRKTVNSCVSTSIVVAPSDLAAMISPVDIKFFCETWNALKPLTQLPTESNEDHQIPLQESTERLQLKWGHSSISLLNESLPMLSFNVDELSFDVRDWSSKIKLEGVAQLKASLFSEGSALAYLSAHVSSSALKNADAMSMQCNVSNMQLLLQENSLERPILSQMEVCANIALGPKQKVQVQFSSADITVSESQIVLLLQQYLNVMNFTEQLSASFPSAASPQVEKSSLATEISLETPKLSLSLLQGKDIKLCNLNFVDFSVSVLQSPVSLKVEGHLKEIALLDTRSILTDPHKILHCERGKGTPFVQFGYENLATDGIQNVSLNCNSPSLCVYPTFLCALKETFCNILPYWATLSQPQKPTEHTGTKLGFVSQLHLHQIEIAVLDDTLTSGAVLAAEIHSNLNMKNGIEVSLQADIKASFSANGSLISDLLAPLSVSLSYIKNETCNKISTQITQLRTSISLPDVVKLAVLVSSLSQLTIPPQQLNVNLPQVQPSDIQPLQLTANTPQVDQVDLSEKFEFLCPLVSLDLGGLPDPVKFHFEATTTTFTASNWSKKINLEASLSVDAKIEINSSPALCLAIPNVSLYTPTSSTADTSLCLHLRDILLSSNVNNSPVVITSNLEFLSTMNKISNPPKLALDCCISQGDFSVTEDQIIIVLKHFPLVLDMISKTLSTLEHFSTSKKQVPPNTDLVQTTRVSLDLKKLTLHFGITVSEQEKLALLDLECLQVVLNINEASTQVEGSCKNISLVDSRSLLQSAYKYILNGSRGDGELLEFHYSTESQTKNQNMELAIKSPTLVVLPSLLNEVKLSISRILPHIPTSKTPMQTEPQTKGCFSAQISVVSPEVFIFQNDSSPTSPALLLKGDLSCSMSEDTQFHLNASRTSVTLCNVSSPLDNNHHSSRCLMAPSSFSLSYQKSGQQQVVIVGPSSIQLSASVSDVNLIMHLVKDLQSLTETGTSNKPTTDTSGGLEKLLVQNATALITVLTDGDLKPIMDLTACCSANVSGLSSKMKFAASISSTFRVHGICNDSYERQPLFVIVLNDTRICTTHTEEALLTSYRLVLPEVQVSICGNPIVNRVDLITELSQNQDKTSVSVVVNHFDVKFSELQLKTILQQYPAISQDFSSLSSVLPHDATTEKHEGIPKTVHKTDLGVKIDSFGIGVVGLCTLELKSLNTKIQLGASAIMVNGSVVQTHFTDLREPSPLFQEKVPPWGTSVCSKFQFHFEQDVSTGEQQVSAAFASPKLFLVPSLIVCLKEVATNILQCLPSTPPQVSSQKPTSGLLKASINVSDLLLVAVCDESATNSACISVGATVDVKVQPSLTSVAASNLHITSCEFQAPDMAHTILANTGLNLLHSQNISPNGSPVTTLTVNTSEIVISLFLSEIGAAMKLLSAASPLIPKSEHSPPKGSSSLNAEQQISIDCQKASICLLDSKESSISVGSLNIENLTSSVVLSSKTRISAHFSAAVKVCAQSLDENYSVLTISNVTLTMSESAESTFLADSCSLSVSLRNQVRCILKPTRLEMTFCSAEEKMFRLVIPTLACKISEEHIQFLIQQYLFIVGVSHSLKNMMPSPNISSAEVVAPTQATTLKGMVTVPNISLELSLLRDETIEVSLCGLALSDLNINIVLADRLMEVGCEIRNLSMDDKRDRPSSIVKKFIYSHGEPDTSTLSMCYKSDSRAVNKVKQRATLTLRTVTAIAVPSILQEVKSLVTRVVALLPKQAVVEPISRQPSIISVLHATVSLEDAHILAVCDEENISSSVIGLAGSLLCKIALDSSSRIQVKAPVFSLSRFQQQSASLHPLYHIIAPFKFSFNIDTAPTSATFQTSIPQLDLSFSLDDVKLVLLIVQAFLLLSTSQEPSRERTSKDTSQTKEKFVLDCDSISLKLLEADQPLITAKFSSLSATVLNWSSQLGITTAFSSTVTLFSDANFTTVHIGHAAVSKKEAATSPDSTDALYERYTLDVSEVNISTTICGKHLSLVEGLAFGARVERSLLQTVPETNVIGRIGNNCWSISERQLFVLLSQYRRATDLSAAFTKALSWKQPPTSQTTLPAATTSQHKLDISLDIEQIILNLTQDSESIESALCMLSLSQVKMNLLSTESTTISGSIHQIELADIRPLSHILFKNILWGNSKSLPLLDFHYEQTKQGDQSLKLLLHSPTFYILSSVLSDLKAALMRVKERLSGPSSQETTNVTQFDMRFDLDNFDLVAVSDETVPTPPCLEICGHVLSIEVCKSNTILNMGALSAAVFTLNGTENQADGSNKINSRFLIDPFTTQVKYIQEMPAINQVLLSLPALELFLSYRDYLLLTHIIATVKPLTDLSSRNARRESTHATSGELDVTASQPVHIDLKCPSLTVTLIDDIEAVNLPLFTLKIASLDMKLITSPVMELSSSLALTIDFFNNQLMISEPVINAWKFSLQIKLGTKPATVIVLNSDLPLCLTVSHGLFTSLTSTFLSLAADMQKNTKFSSELWHTSSKQNTVVVCNKLGSRLAFKLRGSDQIPLPSGCEKAQTLETLSPNGRYSSTMIHSADAWLEDMTPIRNITVDRIGCELHPVPSSAPVVSEVSWKDGTKLLTLRSHVLVANYTGQSIEVFLSSADHSTHTIMLIEPDGKEPIPLSLVYSSSISVRPSSEHPYSNARNLLELYRLLDKPELFTCLCQGSPSWCVAMRTSLSDSEFLGICKNPQITLAFHPSFVVYNYLPFDISYSVLSARGNIRSTESAALFIPRVPNIDFTFASHCFIAHRYQHSLLPGKHKFKVDLGNKQHVRLHLLTKTEDSIEMHLYAPMWIFNKTTIPLFCGKNTQKDLEIFLEPSTSKPVLFSGRRVMIKAERTDWSESFNITVGTSGFLEIPNPRGIVYNMHITVIPGKSKFMRTKIVEIEPYFEMVNNTNSALLVRQKGTTDPSRFVMLPAQGKAPMHWYSDIKDDNWGVVQIMQPEFPFCSWSAPFKIDEVNDLAIKTAPTDSLGNWIVVEVDDKRLITVCFNPCDPKMPPFWIKNDTSLDFTISQKGSPSQHHLPGKSITPWAWDLPMGEQKLVVTSSSVPFEPREYRFKKVGVAKTISDSKNRFPPIFPFVTFTGPILTLVFTHDHSILPSEKRRSLLHKKTASESAVTPSSELLNSYSLKLSGVGISIVTKLGHELLYLSLQGISATYFEYVEDVHILLQIKNFQLDNYGKSNFPVIIRTVLKDPTKPWLHFSAVKSTLYKNIDSYTFLQIFLQEMEVLIDTLIIGDAIQFYESLPITEFFDAVDKVSKLFTPPLASPHAVPPTESPLLGDTVPGSPLSSSSRTSTSALSSPASTELPLSPPTTLRQMLHFKLLHINSIRITMTLAVNSGSLKQLHGPVVVVLETLGSTFANIDRAPLTLNTLMLQNVVSSREKLMAIFRRHFTRQIVSEVHTLLGSTEILGNPVGLFHNLGTGFYDFFSEPAQGLITSPEAFASGLAKGSSSLVKNSVYGAFNTVSKITGAISKGMVSLSFDESYAKQMQARHMKQARHAGDGVRKGFEALGSGMLHGVTGVVTKPAEGAQKDGGLGLVKGVGVGLLGLAAKPAAGVFELYSKTSEGIKNTTVSGEVAPQRVRLEPQEEAIVGQSLMEKYLGNKRRKIFRKTEESYVLHKSVDSNNKIVMLTTASVVVFDMASGVTPLAMTYLDLISCETSNDSITLVFKNAEVSLPCDSQTSALLFAKIGLWARLSFPEDNLASSSSSVLPKSPETASPSPTPHRSASFASASPASHRSASFTSTSTSPTSTAPATTAASSASSTSTSASASPSVSPSPTESHSSPFGLRGKLSRLRHPGKDKD
ncbi:vacuolar protein sorting-associated protein 13 family protein [Pelomyxa schiedti]|nr:vacuolar protein sorting-associated protein 13 family protein [Pelomyxa schiedti]